MRHDEGDVSNVQFEQLSLAAVDLAEAEELIDAQALADEEWLWEEPEFVLDVPASEQEMWEARTEVVRNLTDLTAYEWVKAEDAHDGRWIKSRLKEGRKDSGLFRSRWVLQDIARTKVDGDYFSATPDAEEIELVHVKAMLDDTEIRYLDFTRAFLHAPETELVYTNPPPGWEAEGWGGRLLRWQSRRHSDFL
jgi:hypothetical protein